MCIAGLEYEGSFSDIPMFQTGASLVLHQSSMYNLKLLKVFGLVRLSNSLISWYLVTVIQVISPHPHQKGATIDWV